MNKDIVKKIISERVFLPINSGIFEFFGDGSQAVQIDATTTPLIDNDFDGISNITSRYAFATQGIPAVICRGEDAPPYVYSLKNNELTDEIELLLNGAKVALTNPILTTTGSSFNMAGNVYYDGKYLYIVYINTTFSGINSSGFQSHEVDVYDIELTTPTNLFAIFVKNIDKEIFLRNFNLTGQGNEIRSKPSLQLGGTFSGHDAPSQYLSKTNYPAKHIYARTINTSQTIDGVTSAQETAFMEIASNIGVTSGFVEIADQIRRSIPSFADDKAGYRPFPQFCNTQDVILILHYPQSFYISDYSAALTMPSAANRSPYIHADQNKGKLYLWRSNLTTIDVLDFYDFYANDIIGIAASTDRLYVWAGGNCRINGIVTTAKCHIYGLSFDRQQDGSISSATLSAKLHTVDMPASFVHPVNVFDALPMNRLHLDPIVSRG
jgi:hypothetical protein